MQLLASFRSVGARLCSSFWFKAQGIRKVTNWDERLQSEAETDTPQLKKFCRYQVYGLAVCIAQLGQGMSSSKTCMLSQNVFMKRRY